MFNRYFLLFFFGIHLIISCFFSSVVLAETTLGCCQKTEKNDPYTKTYVDSTEAECKAIPKNTNNLYSVVFTPNAYRTDTGCVKKALGTQRNAGDPIIFEPSVSIPDSKFTAGEKVEIEESTTSLANYIVAIFKYSTGVIGIIAAIVLMLAGIMWVTAAGNQEQIGSAKKMIGGGLMGIVLTFGAFLILSMVNSNLTSFKIRTIPTIAHINIAQDGCCLKGVSTETKTSEDLTEEKCAAIPDTTFFAGLKAENNECKSPTLKYFKACGNGVDKATICAAFSGAKGVEDRYCNGLPDAPRCSSEQVCCSNTEPTTPCGENFATCPSGDGYCKDGVCTPCKTRGDICDNFMQCANEQGKCGASSQQSTCLSQDSVFVCDFSSY
jgi:hypothetical protein